MSSSTSHVVSQLEPRSILPGTTPMQKTASGLLFASSNAGACALTGHVFNVATLATGALFGGVAGCVGLAIAGNKIMNLDQCKSMSEVIDTVAKTVIAFFVGGGVAYGVANLAAYTITLPASLVLMGPVLSTSLGFIAICGVCRAVAELAQKSGKTIQEVVDRVKEKMEEYQAEEAEPVTVHAQPLPFANSRLMPHVPGGVPSSSIKA